MIHIKTARKVYILGIRNDAQKIIESANSAALPDTAVKRALQEWDLSDGRLLLVSIGKAAWSMAKAAYDVLGNSIDSGVVITKYGHSKGSIPFLKIFEAGHPVPDKTHSLLKKLLNLFRFISKDGSISFRGGSALFENSYIKTDLKI